MILKNVLDQFIQNTNGQFIEVSDRTNIYQCMDLVYAWVFCLGFPKTTIQRLYAYEVYTKPSDVTLKYFDLIPNTDDFIPQDGDIAVFDKTSSNIAGHIGVCLGGGTTSSFNCFEQNYPLGTNASIRPRNYKTPKLLGVLRPKLTGGDPEAEALKKELANCELTRGDLQKEKDNQYLPRIAELETIVKTHDENWQKVTDKLGSKKEIADILGAIESLKTIDAPTQIEKMKKEIEAWQEKYNLLEMTVEPMSNEVKRLRPFEQDVNDLKTKLDKYNESVNMIPKFNIWKDYYLCEKIVGIKN